MAQQGRVEPSWIRGYALAMLWAWLALVVWWFSRPVGNTDTWFHIAFGDRFRAGMSVRDAHGLNRFATVPYVPTQWSTEIATSWLYEHGGLPAVVALYGAATLVFVSLLYLAVRRRATHLQAAVLTGVVTLVCFPFLSSRPQVISFALFVAVASAWLATARDGRVRWWIVPVTWVWATAHGMWSAGVVVGAVTVLGCVVDRALTRQQRLRALLLVVASAVAALLTPVGPSLLKSQSAIAARARFIGEWSPPDFTHAGSAIGALLALVLVVRWSRSGHTRWTHLGLLVLAGGWLVGWQRTEPLAVILLVLLIAETMGTRPEPSRSSRWVSRRELAVVVVPTVLAAVVLGLVARSTAATPARTPLSFESALAAAPDRTAVLVDDPIGAWIEWRLPHLDPVTDGVFDSYSIHWLERSDHSVLVTPGWRAFVRDTGARVGVMLVGQPLTLAVRQRLHWEVVARDGRYVLVQAPGADLLGPTRGASVQSSPSENAASRSMLE